MKKNYILNIIVVLFTMNINAQSVCQEQIVINNGVSGNILGQSVFMSGCTGFFN